MQYMVSTLCSSIQTPARCRAIAEDEWSRLVQLSERETLRDIAKRYGVSHETVRQTLLRAKSPPSSNASAGDMARLGGSERK